MVDERESPSAGWREVYDEMEADPDVEAATHRCPDCGQQCENVLRDVYECEEHGVFRASASGGEKESPTGGEDGTADTDSEVSDADDAPNEAPGEDETSDTDESDELQNPAKGHAD